MIRRLHEIEPPKLALPSEKSNKSEDPTAKESLASEFKKLLERARSGVSGVRDEVAALGLALSQAMSTVQQQQVQVRGPAKSEDSEVTGELDQVVDDEGVDSSAQQGVVEVKDTFQRKQTKSAENGPVDDGGDEDIGLGNFADESIDLDQGGEEIALEEEIVYDDFEDFDLDSEIGTDGQDLGAQVTSQHLMVTQNRTEVAEHVEMDLAVDAESGLERVVLSDEEETEDETWSDDFSTDDLTAQVGTSEMARPQFSSKRAQSQGGERQSSGNEDVNQVLSQFETEDSPASASRGDEFQPRALGAENRVGADSEKSIVGNRREQATWTDTSLTTGFSPARDKNTELSMQLSLLRQAYDGLKAQISSSCDLKSKSASGGVTGVGAAAEPRATQNDAAPRVAKYLNRATSQKMMERIETALREAARSRDGKTISLRLDPVHLGQVKCDVSLRDGLLHARITPQNPDVVNAVREHAHELQTALRRLGLNVDRVTVQVLSEKDPASFAQSQGFPDGKSFQQEGNNMPDKERQTPENTFGNEFAEVPRSGTPDAGITPADHWIA
jgi:flagellar hook-length control protein FliK